MGWYQAIIGQRMDIMARAMVVFTAFAIPLSTAMMSTASGLLLLCFLLSGQYKQRLAAIVESPVALWSLALFFLLGIGVLYGSAESSVALDTLSKYKKLILIPIIISLMLVKRWRDYAIWGFIFGMSVLLLMSFMKAFGWLPETGHSEGQGAVIFKSRIAHSIMMAFFFYLLVHYAVVHARWRWGLVVLAVLAAYNLLFMVTGQTGYVIFLCLLFLLLFQWQGWRGCLIALIAVPLLFAGAFFGSDTFKTRVSDTTENFSRYISGDFVRDGVSLRLQYYENALEIVKENPLFGVGTGGFAVEYDKLAAQKNIETTQNPHNEYLMIASQLGVVGLVLFLGLLLHQLRLSFRLEKTDRYLVHGLLVTMAVGCLFNSLLLDSGEGKFFAIMVGILFSMGAHRTADDEPKEAVAAT